MSSPVDQIKERLSIVDVISSYLKLEKAGKNYKAKCPFHNEKTPSFFVSPERGSFYCFGCSKHGDVFNFVQEFEGLDFKGALQLLARQAGVQLKELSSRVVREKEKIYKVMEEATIFYEELLGKNISAKKYLKERGLKESTIRDFRIGFVPSKWREIYSYLRKKSFTDREIELAGFIKITHNDSQTDAHVYDRFRGRIMFPIFDSSGRVVAFSGRLLQDNEKAPKYLNSPDTPIFSKADIFYGLHKAKAAIRKKDFSILVEGQMDLLISHQAGFTNTVALSGTALTSSTMLEGEEKLNNFGQIVSLSKNMIIAFDSDLAGVAASGRAAGIALREGLNVKIAQLPLGVDPADFILSHPKEKWQNILRSSKHVILFYLDKILTGEASLLEKGQIVREEVLPYVSALESNIDKSYFVREISQRAQIKEESIWEDLKKIKPSYSPRPTADAVSDLGAKSQLESEAEKKRRECLRKDFLARRILGIVFWQETLDRPTIKVEEIKNKFKDVIGEDYFKELQNAFVGNKQELIFEAEVFYQNSDKILDDVKEILLHLKEDNLSEKLGQRMQALNVAEKEGKHDEATHLLKECHELSQKINEIKTERYK